VRLALKFAINRQALVDTVLSGHGTVGNDQPVARSSPNFASELPQREYDPEKARYHLKQAGMDSLTVDLKVADAGWGGYGAVDAATLYKEHAKAAGININVIRVAEDGYWADYDNWDFRVSYWAGRPTDDMLFSTTYAAGSPENETFWNNEKFNKLLVAARSELDDKKRRDMYVEMQRLVRDDGGAVIPIFVNFLLARSEKVEHGDLASDWEMDGGRHIERWWFE
jgi:peptide/nickel transport system substrate-binding protein